MLGVLIAGGFAAVTVGFENQAGASTLAGNLESITASVFEIAPLLLVGLVMLGIVRMVGNL